MNAKECFVKTNLNSLRSGTSTNEYEPSPILSYTEHSVKNNYIEPTNFSDFLSHNHLKIISVVTTLYTIRYSQTWDNGLANVAGEYTFLTRIVDMWSLCFSLLENNITVKSKIWCQTYKRRNLKKKSGRWGWLFSVKYAEGRGNTTHTTEACCQLNFNLRSPSDD